MAEIIENKENPNFRLKAIAELLDGDHHFYIPSYQRGYRWDSIQVEDLLKDIWDFARSAKKGAFYCLQPVVVKSKEWIVKENDKVSGWEVIDGQQRLTTLLLLLKYLRLTSEDAKDSKAQFYSIEYQTRPELDFDNLEKNNDIDSFHAFSAIKSIEKWFKENTIKKSKIVEVLFDDYSLAQKSIPRNEWEPQVKVIWYVAENEDDIDSIKIFNNLNKGKIRLTNAELIKALFIMKAHKKVEGNATEELDVNQLSYEWNEMENALHDDRFWYFLANKHYNPSTRIDIIFDFLTEKAKNDDADFAYRKFQNLYDKTGDPFWKTKEIHNFTEAWRKVKEVFQTFLYWYEESTLYHYIGYLIYNDIPISEIYRACGGLSKSAVEKNLQKLIKSKVLIYNLADIDSFSYSEPEEKIKLFKILLFFNIETCIKQHENQNREINNNNTISYYKFPFDLFKLNDWDIEHIGSQTDNPIDKIKDKIIWLSYIQDLQNTTKEWPVLQQQAKELEETLKEKGKDVGNKFKELYSKICSLIQKQSVGQKHTIQNLTLLDAGTNRGYGNALFPTKRQTIIENDTKGVFIPACTRNLFLKYYSKDDTKNTQWKNSWEEADQKAYLKTIHNTIDFIFN